MKKSIVAAAAIVRGRPGDADNSYLIRKLTGAPGVLGVRMPPNGSPLTDGQIMIINRWIAIGAPRN